MPHWKPEIAARYPSGRFQPPGDIGATFMPKRRFYSSSDPATLRDQCREMREAGIDVAVASWWPWDRPDGEGVSTDGALALLFDAAAAEGIKVAFHIEPYNDRKPETVRGDIHYLIDKYGAHPALYRHPTRKLPMLYIYDSYHNPASEWAELFSPYATHTLRQTKYDVVAIALFLEAHDRAAIREAAFDGVYTYFAATGFSYGSSVANWPAIAQWAQQLGIMFIPSIGPGQCVREKTARCSWSCVAALSHTHRLLLSTSDAPVCRLCFTVQVTTTRAFGHGMLPTAGREMTARIISRCLNPRCFWRAANWPMCSASRATTR